MEQHYLMIQLYISPDGTVKRHHMIDGGYEPVPIRRYRPNGYTTGCKVAYAVQVKDNGRTYDEYVATAKRKLTRWLNDRSNGKQPKISAMEK